MRKERFEHRCTRPSAAYCCHGCYAVMQTVLREGLLEQYLAAKDKAIEA